MEKSPRVKIVKVAVERHIKLTEKICPQCGKKFMGMQIQKFCSKRCSNLASYQRNPDVYRESRMRSYRKKQAAAKKTAGKK